MNFDALIKPIVEAGGGVVGIVLLIMLWFNYTLVKKLFEVINSNTEVMVGVKETLGKSSETITKHQSDSQRHHDQCERTHNEVHQISVAMQDMSHSIDAIYKKVVKD